MAYYSCNILFKCEVDLKGFEPLTFSMPLRRAPNCATGPKEPAMLPNCSSTSTSGPGGIRTRDLISAIDARSQLRYRPAFVGAKAGSLAVPDSKQSAKVD